MLRLFFSIVLTHLKGATVLRAVEAIVVERRAKLGTQEKELRQCNNTKPEPFLIPWFIKFFSGFRFWHGVRLRSNVPAVSKPVKPNPKGKPKAAPVKRTADAEAKSASKRPKK